MSSQQTIDNNIEQGIASYVDYLNNIRVTDLMNTLESILTNETDRLSELATKSANALSNLDWAKGGSILNVVVPLDLTCP